MHLGFLHTRRWGETPFRHAIIGQLINIISQDPCFGRKYIDPIRFREGIVLIFQRKSDHKKGHSAPDLFKLNVFC